MTDLETVHRISTLLYDCVRTIDEDKLEDWLGFFTDDCIYKITTRENVDGGFPVALVYCTNKDMLYDRVVAIRSQNVYKLHYDRHLVSNISVKPNGDGSCLMEACYVVYQTDLEGETQLFSTGRYDAKTIDAGGTLKFKEMIVTVDTFAIPNHISTPL